MALVGVDEAAIRLGVSARRVRQMIVAKKLPARKVGKVWVLEESDLNRPNRHPAHRPWKPASAWAVLAVIEGKDLPRSMPSHERHRALKRASEGIHGVAKRLSRRATRRSFYAHPADIARIFAMRGIIRSGASAAADHGIDLIGEGPKEAYVSQSAMDALARSHHLEERSERPNIILRVVADGDWPFSELDKVVPLAVAAVDLLESEDERARRAGNEILNQL